MTNRTCAVCESTFRNLTDYSVHVATAHDLGVGRTERVPLRSVSCWRCASQINVNKTTQCSCGFDLADQSTLVSRLASKVTR